MTNNYYIKSIINKMDRLHKTILYINVFIYFSFMVLCRSKFFYMKYFDVIIKYTIKASLVLFVLLALYNIITLKFSKKLTFVLIAFFLIFSIHYYLCKDGSCLTLFCFAVSAFDCDRKKLILIMLQALIVPSLLIIGLRFLNISPFCDLHVRGHYIGTTRDALGFIWPNQFPYYFLTMCILYVMYRETDISIFELAIMMILNIIVYHFTETRNCLLTVSLLIAFSLFLKFNKVDFFDKTFKFVAIFSFIVCSFIIIMLSAKYNPSNHWLSYINSLTSSRLYLSNLWFVNNGVSIFGRVNQANFDGYNMIDSGYVGCLLQGIFIFVIVITMYTFYNYIASKNNDKFLLLSLMICAYYSTFDHMLLNTGCNPLFIFFFPVFYKFIDILSKK